MQDKNGIEMKTGMVVEIKGAFFKKDNGKYFIDNTPGDPTWCGNDYSLYRIKRNGELAKSNHICFWPICSFVSDKSKNAEAKAWNTKHATIEVIEFENMQHIKEYFEDHAERMRNSADYDKLHFGEDSNPYKKTINMMNHYKNIVASI